MTKKRPAARGTTTTDADTASLSFEQAVERIEHIVQRIESGEAGLEESISQYERGVALLKRCREILEQAEQRIEELSAPKGDRSRAAPDLPDGASDDEPPF